MSSERRLWRSIGRCVAAYSLIAEGDVIAVGVSGGKDSLGLLHLLWWQLPRAPVNYRLLAVTVDLGWQSDFSPVAAFCAQRGIEHVVEKTEIGPIVFEARAERNPCSLCANMRRGALNNAARRLGCNKVALAHHLDDAVETLLLNLFYQGRIACFHPSSYLTRQALTAIRPLAYTPEQALLDLSRRLAFPVVKSCCPASGQTRRDDMKELLSQIEQRIPGVRRQLLRALIGLWAT